MCAAGEFPIVAAYDVENGSHRWTACGPQDEVYRWVRAATEEAVFVEWYDTDAVVAAFSAADGKQIIAGEVPPNADPATADENGRAGDVIEDGVRISGSQSGPLTAIDDAKGELLWRSPAQWAYDDVSADARQRRRHPGAASRRRGCGTGRDRSFRS
jgi:outer membrane protein assembly factor BamB